MACVAALESLSSSGKSDHPVWGSGPSNFSAWGSSCHAADQRFRSGHLLHSSPFDHNLQLVLTILSESASAMEPTVSTTLPKMDKVDTSSVEAPTAQASIARSGSKVSDDNPIDDDPNLLNFSAVVSWITCWMSSLLQTCWPDSGKSGCPVWHSRWSSFHAPCC
jgi:hypothetical protein